VGKALNNVPKKDIARNAAIRKVCVLVEKKENKSISELKKNWKLKLSQFAVVKLVSPCTNFKRKIKID
jgi:hypothetical protein